MLRWSQLSLCWNACRSCFGSTSTWFFVVVISMLMEITRAGTCWLLNRFRPTYFLINFCFGKLTWWVWNRRMILLTGISNYCISNYCISNYFIYNYCIYNYFISNYCVSNYWIVDKFNKYKFHSCTAYHHTWDILLATRGADNFTSARQQQNNVHVYNIVKS